jgi:hypothetical protein
MAKVKKIKKAQGGIRQALSQVKCFKGNCGPVREKGPGIGQRIRDAVNQARLNREENREERDSAKRLTKGPSTGYERDFPGDESPGGFGARDRKGDTNTRWVTDSRGVTTRANTGSMKKGGKVVAKKAKVGAKVVKSIKKSPKKK